MTTAKRGFSTALWDFFCSLKLSIFLLIGLAATSIIGTVIPQGPQPEYLERLSQAKLKLYTTLGFFDMYHSWWFILLLYLLTVNLVACSIKRLPRVWRIIAEPSLVLDDGLEKSLGNTHEFKMDGDAALLRDKVAAFMKAEFAEPVITETEGGEYHLFAQKSPYSRLGVYVVHLSIIIIFIGAIIGSFSGYKAFVQIAQGTSTSSVFDVRKQEEKKLDFSVRCEDFSVSYYDTGQPKEYKSILTILENGAPVEGYKNIPVVVNRPLSYKGITFYQSSFEPIGPPTFLLSVRGRNGDKPASFRIAGGERINLPGIGAVQVQDYAPEVGGAMPGYSGPAAKLEITRADGRSQYATVLLKHKEFDLQRNDDLVFTLDAINQRFATGLQVAKDPGVWVVWTGCGLMVAGIFIAFFLSHKRLWARISRGRAVLAGTANKNQSAFELCFDGLVEKMKKL